LENIIIVIAVIIVVYVIVFSLMILLFIRFALPKVGLYVILLSLEKESYGHFKRLVYFVFLPDVNIRVCLKKTWLD